MLTVSRRVAQCLDLVRLQPTVPSLIEPTKPQWSDCHALKVNDRVTNCVAHAANLAVATLA
jgi:hypothetical protein